MYTIGVILFIVGLFSAIPERAIGYFIASGLFFLAGAIGRKE